jgi:hypothetical protein
VTYVTHLAVPDIRLRSLNSCAFAR